MTTGAGQRSEALLRAAWSLVERDGAEALSLRKLAAAVGVQHPLAYRHFSAKHAVLDELAREGFDQLASALSQVSTTADDARSQLRGLAHAYASFAGSSPAVFRLMFDTPRIRDAPGGHARLVTAFESVVVQGQAAGSIRSGDPRDLARVAWSLVHGVVTLPATTERAVDELALDTLWRGLGMRP